MQKIFQTINHSLLNMLNYTSPKDISIQKLKKQELTTSNSSHSKSKLNFPSNFTNKKKIKKKNSQHHISEILWIILLLTHMSNIKTMMSKMQRKAKPRNIFLALAAPYECACSNPGFSPGISSTLLECVSKTYIERGVYGDLPINQHLAKKHHTSLTTETSRCHWPMSRKSQWKINKVLVKEVYLII